MAIMAATSSQNNRGGNGRYMPLKRRGASNGTFDRLNTEGLLETLNAIDERNIRTIFKQAKDPVELAFDHIDRQSLKKVTTDAIKDSISDMRGSIDDFKDAMVDIKGSLGDFVEFIGKIFTSNEEFIPEEV